MGIDRILVPFDFGEPAVHALEFARSWLGPSSHLPSAVLPIPELGAMPLAAHSVDELVTDAEARLVEALAPDDARRQMRKT